MSNSNLVTTTQNTLVQHDAGIKEAKRLLSVSGRENTNKTYINGLRQYLSLGYKLPTTTLQLMSFIGQLKLKSLKASTAQTYIAAVMKAHTGLGYSKIESSEVDEALIGYRNESPATQRKGEVLSEAELLKVTQYLKSSEKPSEIRDRALFLVLLWSLCRTEEIASMRLSEVKMLGDELSLSYPKAKNSIQSEIKRLPNLSQIGSDFNFLCPYNAMTDYLNVLNSKSGCVFKSSLRNGELKDKDLPARSIRGIILRILNNAGIDADRAKSINGHSLRHTIATFANKNNLSTLAIKNLGNWSSDKAVAAYSGNHNTQSIRTIADALINN